MSEINPIRLNAVPSANPGPTGAKRSTKFSEVIQGLRGRHLSTLLDQIMTNLLTYPP